MGRILQILSLSAALLSAFVAQASNETSLEPGETFVSNNEADQAWEGFEKSLGGIYIGTSVVNLLSALALIPNVVPIYKTLTDRRFEMSLRRKAAFSSSVAIFTGSSIANFGFSTAFWQKTGTLKVTMPHELSSFFAALLSFPLASSIVAPSQGNALATVMLTSGLLVTEIAGDIAVMAQPSEFLN